MAIDAYEIRLGKVFSTDYRFIIPSFQRPYSWRRENMLELIGDLEHEHLSAPTSSAR